MKVSAIISEYNPFHTGHAYHIKKTRENGATHIIAIMSGNFVQRGDFALFDKWTRAKNAILGGVDLVLELPTLYSTSSAENFALGAVKIINSLSIVDELSFGSEIGNLKLLSSLSDLLDTPVINQAIKEFLGLGLSFPNAISKAIAKIAGQEMAQILGSPNNTLAIEYISALKKVGCKAVPFTVKRIGAGYNDLGSKDGFVSSTYLRKIFEEGDVREIEHYMSIKQHSVLKEAISQGYGPCLFKRVETALLYKLRSMNEFDYKLLPDVTEGIEKRIYNAVQTSETLEEITKAIKTKRYTMTRIRRILLYAFLDIEKRMYIKPPQYVKVLAFNDRGRQILSKLNDKSEIPVLIKPADINKMPYEAQSQFEFEKRATDLFALSSPTIRPCGLEYTMSPTYITYEI